MIHIECSTLYIRTYVQPTYPNDINVPADGCTVHLHIRVNLKRQAHQIFLLWIIKSILRVLRWRFSEFNALQGQFDHETPTESSRIFPYWVRGALTISPLSLLSRLLSQFGLVPYSTLLLSVDAGNRTHIYIYEYIQPNTIYLKYPKCNVYLHSKHATGGKIMEFDHTVYITPMKIQTI